MIERELPKYIMNEGIAWLVSWLRDLNIQYEITGRTDGKTALRILPDEVEDEWGSGLAGSFEQVEAYGNTWAFVDRSDAEPEPMTDERRVRLAQRYRERAADMLKRADELESEVGTS